ncbi:MAG: hypothetical protein ABSH25_13295 [Syntrophorhabdales bacterium]|jgi:hypothetical protein
MGDSFPKKAFVVLLAYVVFLVFIPSRGAEIVSLDDGLKACHDGATVVALVGYHFTPRIHDAQSSLLYEKEGVFQQSPFIPNHLYRGPPVLRRPVSRVMFKVV